LVFWVRRSKRKKRQKSRRRKAGETTELDKAGQPTLQVVEGVLRKEERYYQTHNPPPEPLPANPRNNHDYRTLLKHLAAKDITRQKEITDCKQERIAKS
jgi:hypothetical protein